MRTGIRIGKYIVVSALCCIWFAGLPAMADSQLITNGGFEMGTLAGWTSLSQPGTDGGWFVSSSFATPVQGFPTVGPASGTFYAVTDEPNGPGSYVLLQSFTVPTNATSVVLSFDMFAGNQFSSYCNGKLDYTIQASQCGRVDILSAAASPFETGAGVVDNLFSGGDYCNDCPYTFYSFNLTGILTPGRTYQLRFGEVDNFDYYNLGVDNVSLLAAIPTPEPGSMLLLATGLFAIAAIRGRNRREPR
jgi:PEP-CTERM motif